MESSRYTGIYVVDNSTASRIFGSGALLFVVLLLLLFLLSPTRRYTFVVADIRLAGSGLPQEGRLELRVAGIWGTVCDDLFGDVDAGVACSMLGLGYVSTCENLSVSFVECLVTQLKRVSQCMQ